MHCSLLRLRLRASGFAEKAVLPCDEISGRLVTALPSDKTGSCATNIGWRSGIAEECDQLAGSGGIWIIRGELNETLEVPLGI